MGLLFMDPECLRKKRESLSFDPSSGLEKTMLIISRNDESFTPVQDNFNAGWAKDLSIPTVRIEWWAAELNIREEIFCPDRTKAELIRKVNIHNTASISSVFSIKTGIRDAKREKNIQLTGGEITHVSLIYRLDPAANKVELDFLPELAGTQPAAAYWDTTAKINFNSPLLQHYFDCSRFQLGSVISDKGRVDASIWQYNREWTRDQSMLVLGLLASGQHSLAFILVQRLLQEFVTPEGDTIDSSEKRASDEVELDQNGKLLMAVQQYTLWTGDMELVDKHWNTIVVLAEYPLRRIFRHDPSGLLCNCREYWERHKQYGITPGIELAYQVFVALGLQAAADLAEMRFLSEPAVRWRRESSRLKKAVLNDKSFGLVENERFIKRRAGDGIIQETILPQLDAQVSAGGPMSAPGLHRLNPDSSIAFPIAFGFIPPDSTLAERSLEELEQLWEQDWQGGGYGRYHYSSEPDASGPWPFPSLIIARAYAEAGCFDKVERVLNWLNKVPGALAGSWFEFYGQAHSPPFAQIGIIPWNWAEMLILLVNHIIGMKLERDFIRIRPRLLPGLSSIDVVIPVRGCRLQLKISGEGVQKTGHRTSGAFLYSADEEVHLEYPKNDIDCYMEIKTHLL